jgi:hypothetical protein
MIKHISLFCPFGTTYIAEIKLDRLFLASLFCLVQYLWVRHGAYPKDDPLVYAMVFKF